MTTTTDMDKLRRAIDQFRAMGYWARAGQEGGIAAVPDAVLLRGDRFLLWTLHEMIDAFDRDKQMLLQPLHLRHFHSHANEIEAVLSTPELFRGRLRVDRKLPGCLVIMPASQS